ncbi:hypothetical protein TNCV_2085891 [Trichonephila clavipes]|nr:hypothetical protein TNCV_2085891 [Trichonephila clavipes]
MCSKRSPFETAGRESRVRRRPTKFHTCSIDDKSGKKILSIRTKLDHTWNKIALQAITLVVKRLCRTITYSGRQCSPAQWRILYKDIHARSLRCIRRQRIDEADISTHVTVDQCAANCLEEAVWSFTSMRRSCRSSRVDVTFHLLLPVILVYRARWSTASKFASL